MPIQLYLLYSPFGPLASMSVGLNSPGKALEAATALHITTEGVVK